MTTSNTNPQHPYSRPRPLSAVQTVLWLIAGIAGMFALVSTIFAIKLGLEGNLPFSDAQQPATQVPASAAPTPPVTASSAPAIRSAQAAAPNCMAMKRWRPGKRRSLRPCPIVTRGSTPACL